jgi:hypothetical protein
MVQGCQERRDEAAGKVAGGGFFQVMGGKGM